MAPSYVKVPDETKLKETTWEFLDFCRKVEETYGDRVQQFKIDKDSLDNIIRITDVFLNNPKIYN
jgi:adenylate kinase